MKSFQITDLNIQLVISLILIAFLTSCGGSSSLPQGVEEHMVNFQRGQAALSSGDYKLAEIEFRKAIKDYPASAPYYNYLGLTYFLQKRYNEALLEFDKGLRITTDYSDLYNNRGLVYLEMGKENLALDEFKRALNIQDNPSPENAYFNIGRVYYLKQQWPEAGFNFKKATDAIKRNKNKKQPLAFCFYGICLVKQGKYYDALKPLKEAINLQPKLIRAHYFIGVAYYNLKRPEEALNHFMEVESMLSTNDPLNSDLKEYIRKTKNPKR